jgi:hypothetical protein
MFPNTKEYGSLFAIAVLFIIGVLQLLGFACEIEGYVCVAVLQYTAS